MKHFDEVCTTIENTKTRSAWNRGVKAYALDLLADLEEALEGGWICEDDLCNRRMIEKALLNGASSWSEFSWGGCSFCYDRHIAERLCTPSELRKTRNGQRKPNAQEEWIDTQARALYQACDLIVKAFLA